MILLRSAAFAIWFYVITFVLAVAGVFIRLRDARSALRLARLWARLVLSGVRVLCGVRYEVSGREHLPASGPALIASMHQSAFDTFLWLILVPEVTYVLKAELIRIPLVGALMQKAGMIAVDRNAGAGAMRHMLADAARATGEGRQIVIFPEGTRVAPGQRVKLHPGVAGIARTTKLPIIPVLTDSGYRWGRRAFRKYPGLVHVAIQPPIAWDMPRDALLERLAEIYAEAPNRLVNPVDNSVGLVV